MPHIHTEPGQHDLTTSVFIMRQDLDEPRALLHMHKKLGILLPIGGHVELDENPWQGVLHETEEESGYTIDQISVLQPHERIKDMPGVVTHPLPLFLQTHDFGREGTHSHIDLGFGLEVSQDPNMKIGKGESTDLRWLSKTEVMALSNTQTPADVRSIFKFLFEIAVKKWERVPAVNYEI